MDAYYKLKQKYQEGINARKEKIKKETIPVKEKRLKIKKLIGKCVNCNKPGGTIFEERNGTLKAVCGSKTPCNLNINLKRKMYDNMRDLEQKNIKTIENKKMNIIITKLDYLFGLVTSKDEIVDKFNTLKNELAQVSESQLVIQKKYGDIIRGIHQEPLLADATLELVNEIAELKKLNEEYLADLSSASSASSAGYLTAIVEKYQTSIKPLVEQIRQMNYAVYTLETTVDAEAKKSEDEKDAIAKEIKSIYTLVALPYRIDQLEQERK
jgi:hypothetical protein